MDWLSTLNLQTNISKTKIQQFYNYKATPIDLNIKIAGSFVVEIRQTDFLGVALDTYAKNSRYGSWCIRIAYCGIIIDSWSRLNPVHKLITA